MKKYLIVILFIFLYGCSVDPEQIEKTSNQKIKVDFLFEKDGCRIYRFVDGGHCVYWTNCKGNLNWEQGGKNKTQYQNEIIVRDN
jgi:hypothetical protein